MKSRSRAILVIDNAPLQREAWAKFRAAQQQHDKAARDLHRHEEVDVPAYEAWLHRTFPVLITTLRELHEEVSTKRHLVENVQTMAALSGRAPNKIWREQKESGNAGGFFDEQMEDEFDWGSSQQEEKRGARAEDFFEENQNQRASHAPPFEEESHSPQGRQDSAFMREAKAIYRRLVQHLHPDRGGEFTPVRKRLWHEVQQAWAARDTDWLARIEVEWETANEVLRFTSPLSRLRRAIDELNAARRDTQRKLRDYRNSFAWRFTLTERKRDELHRRAKESFEHDIEFFQRQLKYLKSIIASWEKKERRRPHNRFATWQSFY